MSLLRSLARGLASMRDPARADREVADEVEHYREQLVEAHVARGLSPAEARRAAAVELGSGTGLREEVRASGWEDGVETLLADLRLAGRRLRATPTFTLVATLTLAVGIGATTTIVSAVSPILVRPLPYREADRITTLWDRGADGSQADITFGTFRELAGRARAFEALAVFKASQPTLTGRGLPERLAAQDVSAAYLRVLGVRPALGRDLEPSDDRIDGPPVAILTDGLWRRRFGADPALLGRSITLDGDAVTIVGVLPRGFENVLAPEAEVLRPLRYDMSLGSAWGHHLRMAGRLREGVTMPRAAEELAAIARGPVSGFPRPAWAALSNGLIVRGLKDDVTRGVRPALLAILGAATLLLLIAAVNVTGLLLARGAQRRGELALRLALGAGRLRLVRLVLAESLLLAALGGAAGTLVATLGTRALVALAPPGLPRVEAIQVDGGLLAIAALLSALLGLVTGLVPALQACPSATAGARGASGRATTSGRRGTRRALVVTEVALAVVLLVATGLLLRSHERLLDVTPGFDPIGLLTMRVQTSGHRFDEPGRGRRFFAEALEAARRVPGVGSATLTSQLPLSGDLDLYGVRFDQPEARDPGEVRGTFRYAVSPGYVETMGIRLVRGRHLDERDREGAPPVALISESMARRRLPGGDPIGRRLRIGGGDGPAYTIVGVVGDVKQVSLALDEPDAVYTTAAQWRFDEGAMSLVIRTTGDAASLAPAVRQAVWSVDPDQPVTRVATMGSLVARSAAERRFVLTLFEAFALASLVLAVAGLYGALAGGVAERAREIGVRAALGASRRDVVAMVAREGMSLTGSGVAIGIAGALGATRAIVALLFGVSPLDPLTYLAVATLLLLAATVACGAPAWRAARIDPALTLRAE